MSGVFVAALSGSRPKDSARSSESGSDSKIRTCSHRRKNGDPGSDLPPVEQFPAVKRAVSGKGIAVHHISGSEIFRGYSSVPLLVDSQKLISGRCPCHSKACR